MRTMGSPIEIAKVVNSPDDLMKLWEKENSLIYHRKIDNEEEQNVKEEDDE